MKTFERAYRFLASKGLAAGLFLVLCATLIPGTFVKTPQIQLGWINRIVFGLMALNLMLCTARRIRTLAKPVLVMHMGALMVIGGAVVSSYGHVATVNIYEGQSASTAYRWDAGRDMPLGFDLSVRKIHKEFYPVPVRVGVLRGEEKVGLYELKTGESFPLDRYTVKAARMDFPSEILSLEVKEGDRVIGSVKTEGQRDLPPDFPFDFRLVAFRNPSIKMGGVDLRISRNDTVLAEGRTQVNSPLTWEKTCFYNTLLDSDEFGMPFAGIQITNDPGRPYVYAGFAVTGIGAVMYFLRRARGISRA